MFLFHRVLGTGFLLTKVFSEFLLPCPEFLKNSKFRVFLSLKYFKKYWFPLLFWVGVFILGMFPIKTQLLGGRKVKSVCMVYDVGYSSFLLFVTRLILVVIPRISRTPEKFQIFKNNSLLFFGFNCGPVENVYYENIIKYFMRRYRKAVNNNCICRVYVNVFLRGSRCAEFKTSFGYKYLTSFRLPLIFKE